MSQKAKITVEIITDDTLTSVPVPITIDNLNFDRSRHEVALEVGSVVVDSIYMLAEGGVR